MADVDASLYTVGVFQDVSWAERGIQALIRQDFPPAALSMIGRQEPGVASLIEQVFGTPGAPIEARALGTLIAYGSLIADLGSADDFRRFGLGETMRRVGFQTHDGYIFETLVGRGGVLVAARTEPRAADALAVLHAYGGGNAAIGAWVGRT